MPAPYAYFTSIGVQILYNYLLWIIIRSNNNHADYFYSKL